MLKSGKERYIAPGESINRLPVITNTQKLGPGLVQDGFHQLEPGYRNILVFINDNPFIRADFVTVGHEYRGLIDHVRKIYGAFFLEVLIISGNYRTNYGFEKLSSTQEERLLVFRIMMLQMSNVGSCISVGFEQRNKCAAQADKLREVFIAFLRVYGIENIKEIGLVELHTIIRQHRRQLIKQAAIG